MTPDLARIFVLLWPSRKTGRQANSSLIRQDYEDYGDRGLRITVTVHLLRADYGDSALIGANHNCNCLIGGPTEPSVPGCCSRFPATAARDERELSNYELR